MEYVAEALPAYSIRIQDLKHPPTPGVLVFILAFPPCVLVGHNYPEAEGIYTVVDRPPRRVAYCASKYYIDYASFLASDVSKDNRLRHCSLKH